MSFFSVVFWIFLDSCAAFGSLFQQIRVLATHVILVFFFLFFSESEISSMHNNTQLVFPILQSFADEEYCSSVNQKGVLLRVSS